MLDYKNNFHNALKNNDINIIKSLYDMEINDYIYIDLTQSNLNKEVYEFLIQKQKNLEKSKCTICCDNECDVLLTCNHLICKKCLHNIKYICNDKNKKCPFCRSHVTKHFSII